MPQGSHNEGEYIMDKKKAVIMDGNEAAAYVSYACLLYTSPSPRDA